MAKLTPGAPADERTMALSVAYEIALNVQEIRLVDTKEKATEFVTMVQELRDRLVGPPPNLPLPNRPLGRTSSA
jgi:hypothetical protein